MQKYTIILAVIVYALTHNLSFSGGGNDNSKTANICIGVQNCVLGDVSVGKAGDELDVDDTNIPVEPLGKITNTRQLNIAITHGQKIIAFTPTEGAQQNKQIKVLFYAFDLDNMPAGLSNPRLYKEATDGRTKYPWAKTMLKVYRQLAGATRWTEIIASFSSDRFDQMKPIKVYLKPDALAKIYVEAHKDSQGNPVAASFMTADLAKQF